MARPATAQRESARRPALCPVPTEQPGERDRQHRYDLMHLRASANQRGQPYSERTIGEVLNGYFAAYRQAHGQGGTVTKQGNLRPFARG